MLQSTLSFVENMGCNVNEFGQYCLSVTYTWFVEQGAVEPSNPQGIFAAYTPDDFQGDDDLSVTYTEKQCHNVSSAAGCCIGSLLNVRVPAEFQFYSFRAAIAVTEMPEQCAALGVPISTAACKSSQVDVCTQYLSDIPVDCQAFALSFPALVNQAELDIARNDELCTNPCMKYMPQVIGAVVQHPGLCVDPRSIVMSSHCVLDTY
jgi:hypothetical protein